MKPLYIDQVPWLGKNYVREFYREIDFAPILKDATQSQGVCFTKEGKVVVYQDPSGHRGMPGGTIEEGESPEDALIREVYEETACRVIESGRIGYFKNWEIENPDDVSYQLRFWAYVEPLDEEVNDPCVPNRKRVLVESDEVVNFLGWGEKFEIFIDLAKKELEENIRL